MASAFSTVPGPTGRGPTGPAEMKRTNQPAMQASLPLPAMVTKCCVGRKEPRPRTRLLSALGRALCLLQTPKSSRASRYLMSPYWSEAANMFFW